MADMVDIGITVDTGSGKVLKTGSMRRSYNTKKKRRKRKKVHSSTKKSKFKYRKGNTTYKAGK